MPTLDRKVRIVLDWTLALLFRRDIVSLGRLHAPRDEFRRAAALHTPHHPYPQNTRNRRAHEPFGEMEVSSLLPARLDPRCPNPLVRALPEQRGAVSAGRGRSVSVGDDAEPEGVSTDDPSITGDGSSERSARSAEGRARGGRTPG